MFVYLPSRRGRYGTIALACTLAIGGCAPSDQPSDLRPDGPPEVLTVDLPGPDPRVGTDPDITSDAIIEIATFCKTQGPNDGAMNAGDPKRPSGVTPEDLYLLQLCPIDLTMGVPPLTTVDPTTWYVRIEFDELLDPSIEDLVPVVDMDGNPTGNYSGTLANTQPVTLQCKSATGAAMVDVPYDGYYSPAGNSQSFPVGPSLVIQPIDPTVVATQSNCQITLKDNILDKDGNPVPPDQRGPYTWQIAPISVTAISPMDMAMVDPAAAGVDLTFNADVDPTSVGDAAKFTPTVANVGSFGEPGTVAFPKEVFVFGDFPAGATTPPFVFTIPSGATIKDQCGVATTFGAPSVDSNTQTSFTTNPIMLNGITGADSPGNKIQIAFNQYMDATTLTAFTVTPPVANMDVEDSSISQSTLLINGDYQLGTTYTFTLNAGATIADCLGAEDFFGGTCATSATFTNPTVQTTTFTTASAIALNSITPMDNSTAPAGDVTFDLNFNQEIDPASFDASDYAVSPPVTLTASSGAAELGTGYADLLLDGTFAPGTYTITLRSTAVLKDKLGNSFSPTSDQVIHLTVTAPAPASTCL